MVDAPISPLVSEQMLCRPLLAAMLDPLAASCKTARSSRRCGAQLNRVGACAAPTCRGLGANAKWRVTRRGGAVSEEGAQHGAVARSGLWRLSNGGLEENDDGLDRGFVFFP